VIAASREITAVSFPQRPVLTLAACLFSLSSTAFVWWLFLLKSLFDRRVQSSATVDSRLCSEICPFSECGHCDRNTREPRS
jgi:hypothetical protein